MLKGRGFLWDSLIELFFFDCKGYGGERVFFMKYSQREWYGGIHSCSGVRISPMAGISIFDVIDPSSRIRMYNRKADQTY